MIVKKVRSSNKGTLISLGTSVELVNGWKLNKIPVNKKKKKNSNIAAKSLNSQVWLTFQLS